MRIILEGPDGAGKSTLARALSKELGLPVRGKITRVGPDKVHKAHIDDMMQENIILDRCHFITDCVYEELHGKESIFWSRRETYYKYLLEESYLVLVDCDTKTLQQRYHNRGDELWDWKQIERMQRKYRSIYRDLSDHPKLIYINTDNSIANNVEYITTKIRGGL